METNQMVLEKLQGTWTVVEMEREGKPIDVSENGGELTVTGGKFRGSFVSKNETGIIEGALTIDTGQEPYAMDWRDVTSNKETPLGGRRIPSGMGIFEIEEDVLVIHLAPHIDGKDFKFEPAARNPVKRPTEFKTEPGTRNLLATFQRKSP